MNRYLSFLVTFLFFYSNASFAINKEFNEKIIAIKKREVQEIFSSFKEKDPLEKPLAKRSEETDEPPASAPEDPDEAGFVVLPVDPDDQWISVEDNTKLHAFKAKLSEIFKQRATNECAKKHCKAVEKWSLDPQLEAVDFLDGYEPTRYYFSSLSCKECEKETEERPSSWWPSRQTCALGLSILTAAGAAVLESICNTSITDPKLYQVSTHLAAAAQGAVTAAATGAVRSFTEVKDDEVDLEQLFDAVEIRLALGNIYYTDAQLGVVRSWLNEAKSYAKRHIAKGQEGFATLVQHATEEARPRFTLGMVLDKARQAAKSTRPNMAELEQANRRFSHLITALSKFLEVPYLKPTLTRSDMLERKALSPALGSKIMLNCLDSNAGLLMKNLTAPPSQMSKGMFYSASGPGTGKTTGIRLMGNWTDHKVCVIKGSDVQNAQLEKKIVETVDTKGEITRREEEQSIYDWITQRIQDCMDTQFTATVDGRIVFVITGVVLFDDFQYALASPDGKLYKDPISRKKFFTLLKDLSDANMEAVESLDAELAPGFFYPRSIRYVYPALTTNIIFDEFDTTKPNNPKKDAALHSRIILIEATYPTLEDRKEMALSMLPQIVQEVKNQEWETEERKLNQSLCTTNLEKVAEEDKRRIEKFDGNIGFRGYLAFINKYIQFVFSKIAAKVDSPCDFAGEFDPETAANSIQDYNNSNEEGMAEAEKKKKFKAKIASLKRATSEGEFTDSDKEFFTAHLTQIEATDKIEIQEKIAAAIEWRMDIASENTKTIDGAELGRRFKERFKYLTVQSSSEENKSDIDSYLPLGNLVTELWKKHKSIYTKPRPNQLIRMIFAHESAQDPDLYNKLSELFEINGRKPRVCHIKKPEDLFLTNLDEIPYSTAGIFPETSKLRNNPTLYFSFGFKKIEWLTINGQNYPYLAFPNFVYFFKTGKVNDFNNYYNISNNDISARDEVLEQLLIKVTLDESLSEPIRKACAKLLIPKVNIFNYCLADKDEHTSRAESFIVIHPTAEIQGAVAAFRTKLSAIGQGGSMSYEEALYNLINSPSAPVKNSTFDPRTITIFLEKKPREQPDPPHDMCINLPLATPPLSGRGMRATSLIRENLQKLDAEQKELGNETKNALNEAEEDLLTKLIAYDKECAEKMLGIGRILAIDHLLTGAQNLFLAAKTRLDNPLSFDIDPPSETAFRAAWEKIYEAPMAEVAQYIKQKEEMARRAEEQRVWEEQQRQAREMQIKLREEQLRQLEEQRKVEQAAQAEKERQLALAQAAVQSTEATTSSDNPSMTPP